MNGAGELALAGAGFAEDEDIGVGAGHLAGGFQHCLHGGALGFEDVATAAYLALQCLQARGELAHLQLLGRGHAQLVRAAGLDQVIGRTRLHGVHGGVHRGVRGDYHHPHPGCLDAHLRQHVETVVFAQAQVEEAEIEYLPLQQRLGLGRTGGGGHAVAFVLQAVAEGAQNGGFVIHQQYAALVLGYRFHALTPFPSHRKLVQEISCKLQSHFLHALQHARVRTHGRRDNLLINKKIQLQEDVAQALRYLPYLKSHWSFSLLWPLRNQEHSAWNREVPGLFQARNLPERKAPDHANCRQAKSDGRGNELN
ncbi:hypothetical protein D9M68_568120 [compost metagenome]